MKSLVASLLLVLVCTGCNSRSTPKAPGVQLNWTVSTSTDITSQKVCRATTAGASCTVLTTFNDNSTSSYLDTTGAPGTSYYYTIEACAGGVCSLPSNEVSAVFPSTPPPLPPTNLTATLQ